MGSINLKHTGSGSAIALSSDGTSLLLNGTAIGGGGGGADLYDANESSPSAQPSATGSNAIAIGDSAVASGTRSTALGYLAKATASGSVALGNGRSLGGASFSAVIDNEFTGGATSAGAIAMGDRAQASSTYALAMQRLSVSNAVYSIAIGYNSNVQHASSIALGHSVSSTATNQVNIGSDAQDVRISETYTLPKVDGSANQVLTTDGSGAVSWATAGGGSPDLYAENYDGTSTAPSATGANAIALGYGSVASGSRSLVLLQNGTASGNRALSAGFSSTASGSNSVAFGSSAVASGVSSYALGSATDSTHLYSVALGYSSQAVADYSIALGRSYVSGQEGFAAQIANNTTSYGASGANSVAIGWQTKATGANAIAIGRNNTSSDSNSIALGNGANAGASASISILGSSVQNAYSFGYGAESTGYAGHDRSMMLGRGAKSRVKGGVHFGGYNGLGAGRNQSGIYIVSLQSTDATPTALTTTNTTASTDNQVILPEDAAYAFQGTIVVRQNQSGTNAGTDSAAWKVEGLIRRESTASTTVLVSSTVTAISNTPSWGLALSADTTNGGLKIEATGQASRNLRWVGTIYTTEVLHQYA